MRRGSEAGRNAPDSKSGCPRDRARGFKSHPLRHSLVLIRSNKVRKASDKVAFRTFSFQRRPPQTCKTLRFCVVKLGKIRSLQIRDTQPHFIV